LFRLAGRPADGARALDAAIRLRETDGEARLALGRLLAKHGRTEAAVKALQQIGSTAPERPASLALLRRCLGELGLEEAARSVENEMKRLGVGDDDVPETSPAPPAIEEAAGRGPLLLGRYETVREVAVTQHARVIEAIDAIGHGRVAVKLLAGLSDGTGRDAILRFEREARALAQLRHPNVLSLVAYHPEAPAMVLPWMAGGSLADRLRKEAIAPARAVEITVAVLAALGEAHRLGILHRDVKPSNVLFDDMGTAKLSDFGAAHLGDLSTTATAGAIGTFAYMSPEQRLGQPATLASDIYAAGVLLGELLVGAPVGPALHNHLEPPLSATNAELGDAHDAVVARLVQEDPRRRPADAFEARRLLESVPWPERVRPRAARSSPPRSSERPPAPAAGRLVPAMEPGDGRDALARQHDLWLDRDVLVCALDDRVLDRVRAFARAGHPSLAAVLRIDAVENVAWIAPPRGKALADEPRGLSPGQIARLREAVEALHAASGAHGRIDAEHLYLFDGDVILAFPRGEPAEGDLAALDKKALDDLSHG
jgi:serine/threonine-protein kinase